MLAANGLAYAAGSTLPAVASELAFTSPLHPVAGPFPPWSAGGWAGLLCLLFCAACALWLPSALKGARPTRAAVFRFLLLSLAATGLMMALFLEAPYAKIRYLALGWVLAALAAALLHGDLARARPALARADLARTCAMAALTSLQNVRELPLYRDTNPSRVAVRHAGEIEEALARRGIRRAYSLYWQSAVETVLSDGRVEVWGVWGDFRPVRYLVGYDVFAPWRAGEPTAFVRADLPVSPSFADAPQFRLDVRRLEELASAIETIPDPESDVTIYFLDRNPFVFPPGHDPSDDYEAPSLYAAPQG
jgi:hypothetical protein